MLNKSILILSIILLLFSCKKKEPEIIINGKVTNISKSDNIANSKIVLMAKVIESGSYSSNYKTLETVYTNENGEYNVKVPAQRASEYKISIFKDNYFDKTEVYSPDDISTSKENNIDFSLSSVAYVKIKVNNQAPANQIDYMFFSIFGLMENCYDCCTEQKYEFNGSSINQVIKCKLSGNQNVRIEWNVKSSSNMKLYKDSFFVSSFDTTSYNLNY